MILRLPLILFIVTLFSGLLWQPVTTEAAALKCSRIIKQSGREFLVNSCAVCRIVSIQRKRPGADAPISRQVTIPRKSKVTLSFRGPGQSRVTSDVPCKATPGAQSSSSRQNTALPDGKKCIKLHRTANGLALANACGTCRAAVVERLNNQGGKRMQTVLIDAQKAIALPKMGAAYARILSEKPCR